MLLVVLIVTGQKSVWASSKPMFLYSCDERPLSECGGCNDRRRRQEAASSPKEAQSSGRGPGCSFNLSKIGISKMIIIVKKLPTVLPQ